MAISPTGDWLASGSKDITVILWNVQTHDPELNLKGHTAAIVSAEFSQDGRREQVHEVVLRSTDGAARGWEIYTFELECQSGQSCVFQENTKMHLPSGA